MLLYIPDAIKAGEYDSRDLDRLKNDEAYAKCFIRSFSEKGDMEAPVDNVNNIFKFRKELGIHGERLSSIMMLSVALNSVSFTISCS